MKYKVSLVFLIVVFTFQFTIAQDSIRTVIKTPRNGHSIGKFKGAQDKESLYYVDDEKTPYTGKFIEKGWNGEIKSETNYVNGILEGDFIRWTKRGESVYISVKGAYKNGKRYDKYTEWWRENHKKKECFYDSQGEYHGKMIHYHGFSVEEPSCIQFYNHGKRDSTWTWFYKGGKVKTIQNYKNGKEDGSRIDYYENGKKEAETEYLNNKRIGLHSKWYSDGQLKYTCEYTDGKKNGTEILYYKNGQIEKKGEYVNGDKKGHFVWYHEDGSIEEETNY